MAFEGAARITCKGGPPVVPNNTILVRAGCAAARPGASAGARSAPAEIFNVCRLSSIMGAPNSHAESYISRLCLRRRSPFEPPWDGRFWPDTDRRMVQGIGGPSETERVDDAGSRLNRPMLLCEGYITFLVGPNMQHVERARRRLKLRDLRILLVV